MTKESSLRLQSIKMALHFGRHTDITLLCFALFVVGGSVRTRRSRIVVSYSCPENQVGLVLKLSSVSNPSNCSFSWSIGYAYTDNEDEYVFYDRYEQRENETSQVYEYCVFQRNVFISLPHAYPSARRLSNRNDCQESLSFDVSVHSVFLESFIIPSSPSRFVYYRGESLIV